MLWTVKGTQVCVCVLTGGVLGASPSLPSPSRLPAALHHAAMGNNAVATKVLAQARAPVGVVNRLGKSPLVIAQEQRNRHIMQMLTVEEGRLAQRGVHNYLVYNQVSMGWGVGDGVGRSGGWGTSHATLSRAVTLHTRSMMLW